MPLAAGTNLGPYQILSLIAVGGMGEVYRARDTRLDRIVAVKITERFLNLVEHPIIPRDQSISMSEFGERFAREARAVAALRLDGWGCRRPIIWQSRIACRLAALRRVGPSAAIVLLKRCPGSGACAPQRQLPKTRSPGLPPRPPRR